MMDTQLILIQRDEGLFDLKGNWCNELGQKLDTKGNVMVEQIDEEQLRRDKEIKISREEERRAERHNMAVARHDKIRSVARHEESIARHVRDAGVDRHCFSVDRHPVQEPRTLADFNSFARFYANQSAIRPPSVQRDDYQRNYEASTYQTPPHQSSESRLEAMLTKLLEGQQKMTEDFNRKLESMYTDFNEKLEALGTHVEKLDVQVAEAADSIKWQEEFLNEKTDPNSKRACDTFPVEDEGYFDEFEAIFGTADVVSSDGGVVSLDTTESSMSIDLPIDVDRQEQITSVERQRDCVARHDLQISPELHESSESVEEKVYTPKLQFPRARKSSKEVEEASSMPVMIPLKKPRYELPVLVSNSLEFVNKDLNCEKTVSHSCKQRVSRKLGFSIDVSTGKRRNPPKGKLKRTSKPFAKIRIIIPSDLEEKREEIIQQMMENTMKLFPGIVFDKSGGAAEKGRTKNRAATILTDKGGTILPEDPNA